MARGMRDASIYPHPRGVVNRRSIHPAAGVGPCRPRVVAARREQAGRFSRTGLHVAAYEGYMQVCRRLVDLVPGPGAKKAILFNSGSEAVENAVKLARCHTGRQAVVAFD